MSNVQYIFTVDGEKNVSYSIERLLDLHPDPTTIVSLIGVVLPNGDTHHFHYNDQLSFFISEIQSGFFKV